MSNLQNRFNQARKELSGGGRMPISGRVIVQPTKFNKLTIEGKIVSGPNAGTEIEFKYNPHKRALKQADYTKESSKSYVNIKNGGTLRVEGLREGDDGVFECKWLSTFNASPKVGQHKILVDVASNFAALPRRDKKDRPIWRINQLMLNEKKENITNLDDLETAMAEGFSSTGNVTLFGWNKTNNDIVDLFYPLGKSVDGKWTVGDPAERAKETVDYFKKNLEDEVNDILKNGGFTVVPTRQFPVGPEAALMSETSVNESDAKGQMPRGLSMNPQEWSTPTIGMRLVNAFSQKGDNAIDASVASQFQKEFLEFASKDDVARFSAEKNGGWRAIPDSSFKKFFEQKGVVLKDYPSSNFGKGGDFTKSGWSTSALLEDIGVKKNMNPGFVIKAFMTKSATPFAPIDLFNDLRNEFYAEIREAVKTAMSAPAADANAENKTSSEAKKPEPEAVNDDGQVDEADANPPIEETDDLDEILRGADIDDELSS